MCFENFFGNYTLNPRLPRKFCVFTHSYQKVLSVLSVLCYVFVRKVRKRINFTENGGISATKNLP